MLVLMRCFSCNPVNTSSEVSLCIKSSEERCFAYIPRAGFIEEFLLHSATWF